MIIGYEDHFYGLHRLVDLRNPVFPVFSEWFDLKSKATIKIDEEIYQAEITKCSSFNRPNISKPIVGRIDSFGFFNGVNFVTGKSNYCQDEK